MGQPIDATAWILDNLTALHENIALQRRQISELQERVGISESRPPESAEPQIKCGTCGGAQVYVRGRYPGSDKRAVCPTCLAERLDQIRDVSGEHYGQAASAGHGD